MDLNEEDVEISDQEKLFHSSVRENIIFFLLFLILLTGGYALIERFRRRDREDLYSTEDDELKVYRISLWFCVFSFAVAIGSAGLLPISIVSNEVLLLYPNSYYVQWLNSSLIQGLWNHVFLFSNLAIFIFLPFAYLFSESSGFIGNKKGIVPRLYETSVVFMLLIVVVIGIIYVMLAVFYPERSSFLTLLNLTTYHLPFLYSCVSFIGVLLLLVCTPMGFIRLFGVVGQVLVKPNLLRDVNEEFHAFNLEEATVKRKLENSQMKNSNNSFFQLKSITTIDTPTTTTTTPSKLCSGLDELYLVKSVNASNNTTFLSESDLLAFQQVSTVIPTLKDTSDTAKLNERLKELESEKIALDKQRSSSGFQRNLVYPIAMLLLLLLTSITVMLVVQNAIELLIGIKALPLSSRQFTLGISSLSKLGPFGAALEVFIIVYLGITSAVGLYTMPFIEKIRPKRKKTSLTHLIANSALILILTSALPLLSRILGITNFDLLGDFGEIQWLGNFLIVLLYNIIFIVAASFCLIKKFTITVRRELCNRLELENSHDLGKEIPNE